MLNVEVVPTLTTTSRVGARPLAARSPRPVVVLAPGFGSMVALSTSLAEHLASNGYVVVAVQTDLAAEAAETMPNDAHGAARTAQIEASIDMIGSPGFARLVGPVDQHRIVGGHSYAGSIAFNVSVDDPCVAAVFDLDRQRRSRRPATQQMVRTGKKTVAVGPVGAKHFDLTDADAIGEVLRRAGFPIDLGTIGTVATSDTSVIVQRFSRHGAR